MLVVKTWKNEQEHSPSYALRSQTEGDHNSFLVLLFASKILYFRYWVWIGVGQYALRG